MKPTVVRLSLISHTNVGKTTLARTLLRREVGEVLDQAHVTDVSEAHTLLEIPGARLELWDTPGFGDSARLVKRLRREGNPVGWLLHQVWDRFVDRPLWCSQEAVRNIRDEADVVLYLVNASEDPGGAGYVAPELEVLTWMDRPVLLLLNQVGRDGAERMRSWSEVAERWPVIRAQLSLDAFTRCWVEEHTLMRQVVELLEGDKRQAMAQLARRRHEDHLTVFRHCCELMGRYLTETAEDRETLRKPSGADTEGWARKLLADATRLSGRETRKAMAALNRRLDTRTQSLMQEMIASHELEGDSGTRIEQRVRDVQIKGRRGLDERTGALAGAVVSGALTGLAADALAGGLTLGGGLIAGGILGALGGSAIARGYRWIGGDEQPAVTWSRTFLDELLRQVLLRYLAVAHFGRGRGEYRDIEHPAGWSERVDRVLEQIGKADTDPARIVRTAATTLLREAYPHAAGDLQS